MSATPVPSTCSGRLQHVAFAAVLALLVSVVSSCGGSPSGPSPGPPTGPTITGIVPSTGSTLGGTEVTISGTNFRAGASVTIGGVAATNIRVLGTTSIQAVTGAHAAGPADVVVTVEARVVTLPAAFAYVTPPVPTVTAINPVAGPTAGGTAVTITGTNFASGATVAIGGAAANGVTVVSATTIQAVTGARVAGTGDVVVTVGTERATLPAAFTYVPPAVNTPPVIASITVQGTRPNEPANFADLGETVAVSAAVHDAETAADQLAYAWTATGGTFEGTGRSVTWRAPAAAATPVTYTLTLTVTEVIAATASTAATATATQSVTASAVVRVHDSVKEIRDLSVRFLLDFSDSGVKAEDVVRDFWDGCAGKESELDDVRRNRTNYLITSFRIGTPTSATIAFKGTCPFRSKSGVDGCVATPVEWHATYKPTGATETSIGSDQTTAVYRESRWWLCDSDFDGTTTNPFAAIPFIR